MALDLELSIVGCVNNAPVELVGHGQRQEDRLRLDLEVARESLHWDPVLGVLGVLGAFLLADVIDDVPVPAWSRTVLHDDQGREMGAWALSGEVPRGGDRLAYQG